MKKKTKSIVLLSGGLDSVVNFKKAYDETEIALILTFDYGQQSAHWEIESARDIAQKYSLRYRIYELDWLKGLDSGLTRGRIPDVDPSRLDDKDYTQQTAQAVWVPNRNGAMINIAASIAEKFEIEEIVVGFNKEEGVTFPDNSEEFLRRVNASLEYSTLNHPVVKSYTSEMDKTGIVRLGIETDAPFEFVWSCYYGGGKMCGKCESCLRLKRALEKAGFMEEFLKINRWGFWIP